MNVFAAAIGYIVLALAVLFFIGGMIDIGIERFQRWYRR
jgi:hypothetical protein